eukprot:TRINITY_DN32206_c0_g1_i1.p1 TRINITY_DN32206_c0_g1~~TRINITY_DN32206_c0_g1_i1.p1  ORF type:complete len:780 (+),score=107.53 TRINITY_DN32206_c0_g1_i1:29-2341(+)
MTLPSLCRQSRTMWVMLVWLLHVTHGQHKQQPLLVPLPNGGHAVLSSRGPSALRLQLSISETLNSLMVDPTLEDADFEEVQRENGSEKGISVKGVGELLVTTQGKLRLRDSAGKLLTESEPLGSMLQQLTLSSQSKVLLGGGASYVHKPKLGMSSGHVQSIVGNTASYVPYYYSPEDRYGVLVATQSNISSSCAARYSREADGNVSWQFQATAWEMYFMPASNIRLGTAAYYALTGAPPVPPRYAFGFMASRWGWRNRAYIDDTINQFRTDKYPLDAIILDFDWFTNESDYAFQSDGKTWYDDFGFNPVTLPDPQRQLREYRQRYGVRVGGIRKPRLGSSNLLRELRSKGWLLAVGEPGGTYPPKPNESYAVGRNLNFALPSVREWYAAHMAPLLQSGMSFWWNDEGEPNYFTYHNWNLADQEALKIANMSTQRFFSLVRSFTPGMARLGTAAWTGDVTASWEFLYKTPGVMLNWILAGSPYVACDTGGFAPGTSPELLTRWMQVATFMPVMRVHSIIDAVPHWPWNFGVAASDAMRKALNLRYRLLPYHYSLAHAMHAQSSLWIRPMAVDFPEDARAADIATQWMDGSILVAPVLRKDSRFDAYLPAGSWYRLDAVLGLQTARAIQGPTWQFGHADFSEIPCFVKAGTILPMGPVVQSTEHLPGGPLEIFVFAGANGSFQLVEDDGETIGYTAGAKRITTLTWQDSSRQLSWHVSGNASAPGERGFLQISLSLVCLDGTVHKAGPVDIADGGSFQVRESLSHQLNSTII